MAPWPLAKIFSSAESPLLFRQKLVSGFESSVLNIGHPSLEESASASASAAASAKPINMETLILLSHPMIYNPGISPNRFRACPQEPSTLNKFAMMFRVAINRMRTQQHVPSIL